MFKIADLSHATSDFFQYLLHPVMWFANLIEGVALLRVWLTFLKFSRAPL